MKGIGQVRKLAGRAWEAGCWLALEALWWHSVAEMYIRKWHEAKRECDKLQRRHDELQAWAAEQTCEDNHEGLMFGNVCGKCVPCLAYAAQERKNGTAWYKKPSIRKTRSTQAMLHRFEMAEEE